jgi:hypothetical protein
MNKAEKEKQAVLFALCLNNQGYEASLEVVKCTVLFPIKKQKLMGLSAL